MYSAVGDSFLATVRRAFRHDGSSGIAGAGAHVDDVVRLRHDFRVMFNDDDGVSLVRQTVQHVNEQPHIPRMQADGGFFNQVQVSGSSLPFIRAFRLTRRPLMSSVTSLSRWASPPESVLEACPSVR